ncbi:MAG: putative manganese efflux pump MntP [Firmicutes bacterium ADurb.Bin300]|nr:MAG: putative manganese efflux pump MntP [Firmicutes bacterium ADurb.Bin300]
MVELIIAFGLSMDAFAVSICKGLSMRKTNFGRAFVIGLSFGGFQALMPLIGWVVGSRFEDYISSFDHWVAFVLLGFIGVKMLFEAKKNDSPDIDCDREEYFSIRELLILSIATSIDALAAGIAFAVVGIKGAAIIYAISLIGLITFSLSFIGVVAGNKLGERFKKKAEIFGGVILILLGLKILLEHLGVIGF